MRVSIKDIEKMWKEIKDDEELKTFIQLSFSYPENIDTFGLSFFPKPVSDDIPEFLSEIYEELFADKNSAIAAPRGHAKSTITGLIFLMFCIVNNLENYIVYISQNHAKTIQFLTPIRTEFKQNQLLQFIYGNLSPNFAKDEYGKDKEDCFDINGIRIEAVSFEKNLRGFKYNNFRPTLIICDDIEDDARVLNPELRAKDWNKLNKVIIPSLDINGRIKMIGTILHQEGLLKKKIAQYGGRIYTACDTEFKNFLWAERFTKEKLLAIKKDIGSVAFQQEYLNDPIDNTSSLIKREWINQCLREDVSYNELKTAVKENKESYSFIVLGADFAFSDRITADNSAFVSVARKDDYFYVFDCDTFKGLSIMEQMSILKEKHQAFKYDQMGLEENSIKAISKNIWSFDMPIKLFWTGASDQKGKRKAEYEWTGKRNTVGKINLILRLSTALENKRFIIPYKTEEDKIISDQIIAELTSFALADGKLVEAGVHPDIPIAMGYALELMESGRMLLDFGVA